MRAARRHTPRATGRSVGVIVRPCPARARWMTRARRRHRRGRTTRRRSPGHLGPVLDLAAQEFAVGVPSGEVPCLPFGDGAGGRVDDVYTAVRVAHSPLGPVRRCLLYTSDAADE